MTTLNLEQNISLQEEYYDTLKKLIMQPDRLDLESVGLYSKGLQQLKDALNDPLKNHTFEVSRDNFILAYKLITAAYKIRHTGLLEGLEAKTIDRLKVESDSLLHTKVTNSNISPEAQKKIRKTINRHRHTLEELAKR